MTSSHEGALPQGFPYTRGTVEDSHAKLAAEIREAKTLLHRGDLSPSHFTEWAARVEQLGQELARERQDWLDRYKQLEGYLLEEHEETDKLRERYAKLEAEIAKVREEWIAIADAAESLGDGTHTFNVHAMRAYAARLGGATP